jgi:hypothetical protein
MCGLFLIAVAFKIYKAMGQCMMSYGCVHRKKTIKSPHFISQMSGTNQVVCRSVADPAMVEC